MAKHKVYNLSYEGPTWCWCRGTLECDIDGKHYRFEPFWESGGTITCDNEDNYYAIEGDWLLNKNYIPKGITVEMAEAVIDAMNEQIPKGCCGGCI